MYKKWIQSVIQRFFKGTILISWIGILAFISMFAASNSISTIVFEKFDVDNLIEFFTVDKTPSISDEKVSGNNKTPETNSENIEKTSSGMSYLKNYLHHQKNPPPIISVLEKLYSDWDDKDKNKNIKKEDYKRLFEKIDEHLTMLASSDIVYADNSKITFDMAILAFFKSRQKKIGKTKNYTTTTYLPDIAVSWIIAEKPKIRLLKARIQLIDTFVLLIVLGAFGSLIFLTRDYIIYEEETLIKAYIFRPILGMFLAISMFIIDISAHALISQADIFSIRKETLYLLGFSAGLLSEQAYDLVRGRAYTILLEEEDEKKVE